MTIKLSWKFADGKHLLLRQGSKLPVKSVVPDQVYPHMWRIQSRDGQLSDMVNLSRARDAAITLALSEYIEGTRVERRVQPVTDELPSARAFPVALTAPSSMAA